MKIYGLGEISGGRFRILCFPSDSTHAIRYKSWEEARDIADWLCDNWTRARRTQVFFPVMLVEEIEANFHTNIL